MNPWLLLTNAIMTRNDVVSATQLNDITTTANMVAMQESVTKTYADKCTAASNEVARIANLLANDPDNKQLQNQLTAANAESQKCQTLYDQRTKQVDSATQEMQNIVQQDSINMQQVLQLAQAYITVQQALSNLISKN